MEHKKLNAYCVCFAALLVTCLLVGVTVSGKPNELTAVRSANAEMLPTATPTPTPTITPTPTPGLEPTPTPGATTTTTQETTTTVKECFDGDGDSYGDNCAAGTDCDDTDAFYHDICPDCTVVVIPKAFGWLLGEEQKNRLLLVIGKSGTIFDENTEVRWEPDAIGVVSKRIFLRRFMLMKVSIDGAAIDRGEYRALIGNCLGKLSLVK